jgi:hypothetical protein
LFPPHGIDRLVRAAFARRGHDEEQTPATTERPHETRITDAAAEEGRFDASLAETHGASPDR